MRVSALKHFFLLTVIFGYLTSVQAQVEPTDSAIISNGTFSDSVLTNKQSLSTDSIYGTSLEPGLTPEDDAFLVSLVEYTADDSIFGSPTEGVVYLYNNAIVTYQDIKLKAGFIRFDIENKELYAEGITDSNGVITQKPLFTEAGKDYRADAMRYNFESKKAMIKKVITKEGEGFLHGQVIKKVDDEIFYVKNASFTTCSHEHPHFRIKTPKAKVISGRKVVTQFAYLEVLDVPTPLMVPFGFFPTNEKRQSGIIIPTYGSSDFRGYFLRSGGYYWAASDYFDVTLTGDIFTQGGYGVQASTGYRKRYRYSGNLAFNYNLLRYGREEFAQFNNQAFNNSSDFNITWTHNQDAKARPDFRFNSRVNIATQNYYAITGNNAADVLTNQLASSISFQKLFPSKPLNLTISLTHNQNTATNDVTYGLPRVNFGVNRIFPFERSSRVGKKAWYEEIFFTYGLDAKNDIETKFDQPLFTRTVFRDSSRAGIQHNIPIQATYKVFKYFTFNPNIRYTERWLFKQYEYGFSPEENRAVVTDTLNGFYANRNFSTGANVTTNLYGLWNYKGYVRAIYHRATPSVGITYTPDFSTDFWGYYQQIQSDTLGNTQRLNRFSASPYGSAPSGTSGVVNMGLQNILEAKIRDDKDTTGLGFRKIQLFERLSVNTGYDLAKDSLNWSSIQFAATSTLFKRLISLNYSTSFSVYGFDEDKNRIVPRSAYAVNGQALRNLGQTFAAGVNLSADTFNKNIKKRNNNDAEEDNAPDAPKSEETQGLGITGGDVDYYTRKGFVDFNVPWTLSLRYNLGETKNGLESTVRQSITADGSVTLTQNWAFTYSTGYDLEEKDFTYTSFNFVRNLHCWELTCGWVPFGAQQNYTLTIRVRAPVLSDLKLERRRGIGDF